MNSGPEIVSETTETLEDGSEVYTLVERHWGAELLRNDGSSYLVRWDPGYGSGVQVPYDEREARADVAQRERDGMTKRLVTRTETTVSTTTPWVEPPA